MAANLTKSTELVTRRNILAAFAREDLTPHSWSNRPHDRYAAHDHPYHKVLYCLRGSITFHIEDTATSFELHPGDCLDIEPQTTHSAIVGPSGVECMEAAQLIVES